MSDAADFRRVPDAAPATPFTGTRIGQAVISELGGSLAVKGAMVLQTIVLARLFAPSELGAWNTVLLVVGAVTTMTNFGLDRYLLVQDERDFKRRLDTAFTLTSAAAACAVLLLLAVSPVFAIALGAPESAGQLRFLSPMVLGVALTLPTAAWERQLRYGMPKIPLLAGSITLVGAAVLMRIGFSWGLDALLLAQLVSFIASTAALWLLAPVRPRFVWHPKETRAQLAFGAPFFLSGVAAFVSGQGDDLLVRLFHGDEALGHYVVAFYLPGYLLAIVEMMARVAVPALAPLRSSPTELKEVFTLFSRYIAAVAVGVGLGLALFAPELVRLLYGDSWVTVVPLVQLFAIAFVLRGATGFHWQLLVFIFQRTRYLLGVSLASAVFMLVVAPPLIWKFGLFGGAIYSFVQFGVMTPLVRFPLIRQTLGDLSFLRSAVPPVLAGVAAVAVCLGAGRVGAPLAVTLCAYVLTYGAVLLRLDPPLVRRAWSLLTVSGRLA